MAAMIGGDRGGRWRPHHRVLSIVVFASLVASCTTCLTEREAASRTLAAASAAGLNAVAAHPSTTTVPVSPVQVLQTDRPSTEYFVAELAEAGIAVYELGSAEPLVPVAVPASPLRLTDEQASNAALSASSGSGLLGAQVDRLIALPALEDGAQPIAASLLIAAWAADAPTPAAATARALLAGQDLNQHQSVVFPFAVLTLFVAEVVPRDQPTSPVTSSSSVHGFAARTSASPHGSGNSVCQLFQGFVNDTIRAVFEAIGKLPNLGYRQDGWDWARWIANRGVDLTNLGLSALEYITINGVKVLVGPLVSVIASVASVIAVSSAVLLLLQPWSATIEPRPLASQRDGVAKPGQFNLTVRTNGPAPDRWPTQLAGCAQWAGVTLPSLTPRDAEVTWTVDYQHPEPMIQPGATTGRLSPDGTASLAYQTIIEPPEVARGDLQQDGIIAITAAVHRSDLDQLRKQLVDGLFAQLPQIVKETIGPSLQALVEPRINEALRSLTTLQDISTRGFLPMTYHTRNEPPTTAVTTMPPSTAPSNRDAFCAYLKAWPGAQTSDIASMGAEGLAMIEGILPITPAEMADEVTILQTFYTAAANMDFEAIGANADPFGIAWNSIFTFCGLTPPG